MNTKIFFKAIKLKRLFYSLGIKPADFAGPVFCSLAASLFEGISIGILVPVVNGIIGMNFNFVTELSLFKVMANIFPNLEEISSAVIFILFLTIIFSAAIFKNILQYISITMVSYQVRKASNGIRNNIFERYLSFGKMFFDRNSLGYLYNVLINYTSLITEQVKKVTLLISAASMFVVYIILMVIISWRLTLFVAILLPLLNRILNLIIQKIKKTSKSYEASFGEFSKKISNILSCMPLVKLYTREKNEYEYFSCMNEEIKRDEFNFDKKYNLIKPVEEIFFLLVTLLLVSAVAFIFVKQKSGEIAGFLIFFLLLKRAQGAFLTFSNFVASMAMVKGPINAIFKILNSEDKFIIPDGKNEFTGLKRNIEFKDLNFSYSKERLILNNITFSVTKGKITAIVGPTGAGKTTLINLILRFYDCPPSTIMIDGMDIRNFTFKSLMPHIAVVSQDTLLFNDSIKANIIYGLNEKISDQILLGVIKKARLYDFIMDLPDGLDTYIGDKGIKLSGGERQRVSIARALLKGSEILILDEATSSLDTKTEGLIQKAIDEIVKDRTTIVIAHRLSTIKNADKIIFIDSGKIIESGALEELLQKKGIFYNSWQEQRFY